MRQGIILIETERSWNLRRKLSLSDFPNCFFRLILKNIFIKFSDYIPSLVYIYKLNRNSSLCSSSICSVGSLLVLLEGYFNKLRKQDQNHLYSFFLYSFPSKSSDKVIILNHYCLRQHFRYLMMLWKLSFLLAPHQVSSITHRNILNSFTTCAMWCWVAQNSLKQSWEYIFLLSWIYLGKYQHCWYFWLVSALCFDRSLYFV